MPACYLPVQLVVEHNIDRHINTMQDPKTNSKDIRVQDLVNTGDINLQTTHS